MQHLSKPQVAGLNAAWGMLRVKQELVVIELGALRKETGNKIKRSDLDLIKKQMT